jgi:hypothetical protein
MQRLIGWIARLSYWMDQKFGGADGGERIQGMSRVDAY